MTAPACGSCRFAAADGAELERAIPGLAILSSGFGSTAGATALCLERGEFVARSGACALFAPREAAETERGRAGRERGETAS